MGRNVEKRSQRSERQPRRSSITTGWVPRYVKVSWYILSLMHDPWNNFDNSLFRFGVESIVISQLLMADVRTARNLLARTLSGSTLTRRERKQLLRTVSDLFRLVPFSMFLIIPFMEFALPFALRIFPNMLPSTFQDSLKAEESMKRELQSRIAMAQFFQE